MCAQMREALLDRLVGQGADPKPFYRLHAPGFLHHPALYQLTLLAGIATVDNLVALFNEFADSLKLLLVGGTVNELDAESGRNHREGGQRPTFPIMAVVLGLLEGTEMAECPCDAIPVTLHVAVATRVGSEDTRNVASHTRFLRDTQYHFFLASSQISSISARVISLSDLPSSFAFCSR